MEMHPLIVKFQEHKTVQHIRLHHGSFSSMVVMVTFPIFVAKWQAQATKSC